MQPGTDAEIRALPFGQAVRCALAMHTCPVSFWAVVQRRDAEDMLPAVVAPRLFAFLLGPAGRWLALAALVLAVWGHGWLRGAAHEEAKAEALRAKQEAAALAHAAELARRADEITLVYLTQTRTVRERGQTIVREVPRYVTAADDAACPTAGLVRVLNAAARNELPGAPGRADAAAAGPATDP